MQKHSLRFIYCMILLSLSFFMWSAAAGAPPAPIAQHNQYMGDYDGNYEISWNMWWGNNATSVKLYEQLGDAPFTVVAEEVLTDATPSAQKGKFTFTGKAKGLYKYYIELSNSFGSSRCETMKVGVGQPSVILEKILLKGVDVDKAALQVTIAQGSATYTLETKESKAPQYEVLTNNSSVISVSVTGDVMKVTGLKGGRASIRITEKTSGATRFIGVRVKNADGTLPGMPEYLSIGSMSEDIPQDLECWEDFHADDRNKRMDIRYVYLNEGPVKGWRTSLEIEGQRAFRYIENSRKLGMIPFFVYYNIPEGAEDYNIDLRHMQDATYMKAYYEDLKFLLELCKKYAEDDMVGIIFEPDFLGYMMKDSGLQPHELMASVSPAYKTVLDPKVDPVFPDTLRGLVECVNYIVNKYYPEAYFGWQFNLWSHPGPGISNRGLMHSTDIMGEVEGEAFIKKIAAETAEYYINAGVLTHGADFISIDKYGLDGASQPGAAQNPADSIWFWNSDQWNNYLIYCSVLSQKTGKSVIPWQIPVGHINSSQAVSPYTGAKFTDLPNTTGKYEDSAPSFFYGDTFIPGSAQRTDWFGKNNKKDPKVTRSGGTVTYKSHMEEARDAGIISIMFGAGVGMATDGVNSPPSDNYWWLTATQRYFKNPVPLKQINPVQKPYISNIPAVKVGADIVINGSNFKADSVAKITINGVAEQLTILSQTASKLVCQNRYPVGNYTVQVVNGADASNSVTLKVISDQPVAPSISSIASVEEGVNIVIKGADFTAQSQAMVMAPGGYTAMVILSQTATELVVKNTYLPGRYTVKVVDGALESKTATLTVTEKVVVPAPSISSIPAVEEDTDIVINGANFTAASEVVVVVNGADQKLTVKAQTATALTAANTLAPGTYSVKVVNGTEVSNTASLTVNKKQQTVTAWAAGVSYVKGNQVTYAGATYTCLQPHTSLPGWTPAAVASLWKKN